MTTLYFVRHCLPNTNNHDDLTRELSEQGMKDRKLVTSFFQDKKIGVVLSSPYKRAVDTVSDLADTLGLPVKTYPDLRERKVGAGWIKDFLDFTKRQWEDMDYKLPDGESLREVQERNIAVVEEILLDYSGKNIVIGSHGTALSTIINYYDRSFGYEDFYEIIDTMPWIVEFVFDEDGKIRSIQKTDPKK
ncbi:MAG: histidine phosphatase family protein [Clostridiales bacterium]|nr:histidine phosphatase family protein [Clostridiales bacterium]